MADMVGLSVTVEFADGSTDAQLWTPTGISTSAWTMTQGPGSTFSNPFILTNSSGQDIVGFTMHGAGSTTLFDRASNPSTAGTANGRDFRENSSFWTTQDIFVNYFDEIRVGTAAPVGDIFAGLEVSFQVGFLSGGADFEFVTDTDTATSILIAVPSAVPEPGSLALAFALGGLVSIARRRR